MNVIGQVHALATLPTGKSTITIRQDEIQTTLIQHKPSNLIKKKKLINKDLT
jgi:hypothetical protein